MRTAVALFLLAFASCVVFVATASAVVSGAPLQRPLLHIVAEGTPFEVGRQVGTQAAHIIQRRLRQPAIVALLKWQSENAAARTLNATLYRSAQACCADMLEEMRGIAEGSDVALEHVWFLQIHVEMDTLASQVPQHSWGSGLGGGAAPPLLSSSSPATRFRARRRRASHCTDVFSARNRTSFVRGHNEDAGDDGIDSNYFLSVKTYHGWNPDVVLDEYHSFAYAASMGGGSFAMTRFLTFSDNMIVPINSSFAALDPTDTSLLPQRLLHRLAFRCQTIACVTSTLLQYRTATGFSYNVGTWNPAAQSPGTTTFVNIEADPLHGFSVFIPRPLPTVPMDPGVVAGPDMMAHANEYLWFNALQDTDPDSAARVARIKQMGAPRNREEVLAILGDTQDPTYPIFRRGEDGTYTVASAVFDLERRQLEIFRDNPKFFPPEIVVKCIGC